MILNNQFCLGMLYYGRCYCDIILVCRYSAKPDLQYHNYLAGQELEIVEQGGRMFFVDTRHKERVAAASGEFIRKMQTHKANGYIPVKAYVNYVAYWTKKNGEEPGTEKKIILPRVILKAIGSS